MQQTKTAPRNRNERLRKSFRFFDVNSNGSIEHDDILAMAARVMSAYHEPPDSQKGRALVNGFELFWRELLSGLDLDQDRRISEEEYVRGMVSTFADRAGGFDQGMRPLVKAILDVSDRDDDGTLNAEEFESTEQAIGNPAEDSAEGFQKLDKNSSGTLTVDEIIEAAREYHTGTDPDASGNWLFGLV